MCGSADSWKITWHPVTVQTPQVLSKARGPGRVKPSVCIVAASLSGCKQVDNVLVALRSKGYTQGGAMLAEDVHDRLRWLALFSIALTTRGFGKCLQRLAIPTKFGMEGWRSRCINRVILESPRQGLGLSSRVELVKLEALQFGQSDGHSALHILRRWRQPCERPIVVARHMAVASSHIEK